MGRPGRLYAEQAIRALAAAMRLYDPAVLRARYLADMNDLGPFRPVLTPVDDPPRTGEACRS